MTVQQKENMVDSIKIWAFPVLLALVTFFLTKLDKKIEIMSDTIIEMKVDQKIMKNDVEYLRKDTNEMKIELKEMKREK